MKRANYTKAIVRCYRSNASVDPNVQASVANAISAGLSTDVYIFPCPKCSTSAAAQVNASIANLRSHNVKFNTYWLDIEGPQYWSTSISTNVQFFKDMVRAAQAQGVKIGVYASKSGWDPIMGTSTAGSQFPLWYAHYDGVAAFSDFTPFGGWTRPYMKQFLGDVTLCGVGVDENWSP